MTKMLRPLAMLAACLALALEFKDGSPAAGMNGAAEKLIAGKNRV
jgi:hypothetical protein